MFSSLALFLPDIYVLIVSHAHHVATKGHYIALVATTVETDEPEDELKPGLDLLGPWVEKFVSVSDMYEPNDDGKENQVNTFTEGNKDNVGKITTKCMTVCNTFFKYWLEMSLRYYNNDNNVNL